VSGLSRAILPLNRRCGFSLWLCSEAARSVDPGGDHRDGCGHDTRAAATSTHRGGFAESG
jgi:hypothetical protein